MGKLDTMGSLWREAVKSSIVRMFSPRQFKVGISDVPLGRDDSSDGGSVGKTLFVPVLWVIFVL